MNLPIEHPDPGREHEPLPDGLVWHYTDGNGLISILSNHVLWATASSFLNDREEAVLGMTQVLAEANRRAAAGEEAYRALQNRSEEFDPRRAVGTWNLFILSASRAADSLAMWRNYGRERESYAIGLDPGASLSVLATGRTRDDVLVRPRAWAPVVYEPSEQAALVRKVIDPLPQRVQQARNLFSGTDPAAIRQSPAADVLRQMPPLQHLMDDVEDAVLRIKHRGFLEEHEARFSTTVYVGGDGGVRESVGPDFIRYRSTPYGIAPYLELTGSDQGSGPTVAQRSPLPVRALMISPSPNGEAAVAPVKALMRDRGYDLPVYRSTIPFRS